MTITGPGLIINALPDHQQLAATLGNIEDWMSTVDTADVVALLTDLIANQGLEPGDRLPPIRELAVRFGVKAGTVRDALLDAQGRGLVKVLPRVGAIVQADGESQGWPSVDVDFQFEAFLKENDQNLFHVLETRETIELAMVAQAAKRRELADLFQLRQILEEMAAIPLTADSPKYAELDVDFHLEIGRLSGNFVMTSLLGIILDVLKPHLDRIRWSDSRREAANASHARIYSALVAGNDAAAQDEMRDHIRIAYDSLLAEMRNPPLMNGITPTRDRDDRRRAWQPR